MAEEAKAVLIIFQRDRQVSTRQFERQLGDVKYYAVKVTNRAKALLDVGIIWQAHQGPTATSQFTEKLRSLITTRYWFMSGICAGVRADVKLGDVVVADKSVSQQGKMDAESHLVADINTAQPSQTMLHGVRSLEHSHEWRIHLLPFDGQKDTTLPPLIQDVVTLLLRVLSTSTRDEGAIEVAVRSLYAQNREAAVKQAWELAVKLELIDEDGNLSTAGENHLKSSNSMKAKLFSSSSSASSSQRVASIKVGTIFSSELVRQDLKSIITDYKTILASRKIIGVEMEVDAFYKVLTGTGVLYLAVKGVCDFGDQWKDDAYHDIAAEHAAAVLLDYAVFCVEGTSSDAKGEQDGNDDDGGDGKLAKKGKVEPSVPAFVQMHVDSEPWKKIIEDVDQLQLREKAYQEAESILEGQLRKDPACIAWKAQEKKLREAASLPQRPAAKLLQSSLDQLGLYGRSLHPSSLRFDFTSGDSKISMEGRKPKSSVPTKKFLDQALGTTMTANLIQDCNNSKDIKWTVNGLAEPLMDDREEEVYDDVEDAAYGEWEDGDARPLDRFRYSRDQRTLQVEIKGKQYTYSRVPPDKVEQLRSSEQGTHYNSIKSTYNVGKK